MATDRQQFIRTRSLRLPYLYCAHCRAEPPRFVGGLCDPCREKTQTQTRTPTDRARDRDGSLEVNGGRVRAPDTRRSRRQFPPDLPYYVGPNQLKVKLFANLRHRESGFLTLKCKAARSMMRSRCACDGTSPSHCTSRSRSRSRSSSVSNTGGASGDICHPSGATVNTSRSPSLPQADKCGLSSTEMTAASRLARS